ncbi:MAG: hypothetical protein GY896_22990 [Gammaproteobacteria bacterium]|nr:hypothetical protein [Gammaproteobacteria bacterium]
MADNEINAKLTADTDEAVDDVDNLADSFDEAADAADQAGDAGETFGQRMDRIGGKLTGVGTALSVGVTAPLVGLAGATINMGMQAVEAESLFETSFGDMADEARAWSLETSDALGLNEFELRRQSATMFTMTESMGVSRDAAKDMAQGITVLAGDMASFFNTSPEEAFNKLRSGITGEAEPLKQLGILVTENFIKQTDFAKAILATGRELTEQEKVMARYHAILDQTSTAQGDLARTAESPANRIRRMGESIQEAGTKLGLALIPAVERVLPLLEQGVEIIESVVQKFSELPGPVQDTIIVLAGVAAAAGPVLVIVGQMLPALAALSSAWTASGIAAAGFSGSLAAVGTFITGTLLPVLAALAVGVLLGGAIGIAISEFLEWLGVIESVEEKTRKLVDAMEPTQQEIRLLAEASAIADREITDWDEAMKITSENIENLRNGTEGAINTTTQMAEQTEVAAAAAQELAAQEEATAKATAAAAEASKKAATARAAEQRATKALADSLGTAGLEASMRKTGLALEELNRRGEELSNEGLAKVISQIQKLKAEGVPLTGALRDWNDAALSAAASMTPLSDVLEDMPVVELTDDIKDMADGFDFGAGSVDTMAESAMDAADAMSDADRALLGFPPATRESSNAADLMTSSVENLSHAMQAFGIDANSVIGQVMGLASTVTSAIPAMTNFQNSLLGQQGLSAGQRVAGTGQALASGFGSLMQATQTGGAARSAAMGALSGASTGAQIGGPIGAGVGAAVGAVVGFFRGRGRDRIRAAIQETVGADVSEDLAMAISDAAEAAGRTVEEQSLLSLADIFGEVGVEEFEGGVQGAADAITQLMQRVADGSIEASEGVEAIGSAFAELVNQTFEAGRVADAGIIQLVRNARELGHEIPEIAAFVEQQLAEAAVGIGKVIGGIQIVDPQDAQDQATLFAGAFFATLEEVGLLAAVDAFKPAFDELKSQLEELGFEDVDLGGVGRLFRIAGQEEFRPLLEGIEGLNQALVGVSNAGFLTTDMFSAFQNQAQSAFEQLTEAGLRPQEALQQIAPFLQSAIDAAERFGIPLDANTQALIDQAEAAGIAFETDPMNRMADAMVLVADLLGATDEQLANLGGTANETADTMQNGFAGASDELANLGDTANQTGEQMSDSFEDSSQQMQNSMENASNAAQDELNNLATTMVSSIVPAADEAANATDRIADAARRAAEAARDIKFPDVPNGGGGGGGGGLNAAAGFQGVLGKDTLIQAHRGEFVNILTQAQTRAMDFFHAQNGMGPAANGATFNMGDTNITFTASGNRKEDDSTLTKLLEELAVFDGEKRRELQRMLGVKP